jgi:uncharacterized membrane protein HdeD (DUF308 family)
LLPPRSSPPPFAFATTANRSDFRRRQIDEEEDTMIRERTLKVVLVLAGLLFLAGFYPLTQMHNPELACEQMLGSVYGALGIFLLLAARNPSAHRSLVAFTAWSSLVHGSVMAMQAFRHLIPREDLLRAVVPILVIGLALIAFAPAKPTATEGVAK